MKKVRRAVISVSNKTSVAEFAGELAKLGIEIISTGGTASLLRCEGIPVRDVSEVTGFPEIMHGRIKTLHPGLLGGILYRRGIDESVAEKHGITPIDLVVVNLYPFVETTKKPGCTYEEAVENIDIGGPTMIRSAAKNHEHVAVVVDPSDYDRILEELKKNDCCFCPETLKDLALKAFLHTSAYDSAIASYFKGHRKQEKFPDFLQISLNKIRNLRYGENPHQNAALYVSAEDRENGLSEMYHMHGKDLSYNNILDIEGAFLLVMEFEETACAIIKHTNPCGIAVDSRSLLSAYKKAYSTDPVSAFGGIAAFNRMLTGEVAEELSKNFYEVVIAPDFEEGAKQILTKKKNLRIIKLGRDAYEKAPVLSVKSASGAFLVQERDMVIPDIRNAKVVTRRAPTEDEYLDLAFAWKVVRFVKSNAIVFAKSLMTVGTGAGQMSRVDSVKIAIMKAQLPLKGSCVASDGFFPFRDGVDEAARAGAAAVIEPGGSIRDEEVINAANEHGMAMIFTGYRHFRH
jgi:phosphoribosylaminoimidazolecarboxamide formyltransferase/IMP cyclohydrolase